MAWIIVGLGNPNSEYADTRHNVGKDFVEALSPKLPKKAKVAALNVYMNNSGGPIKKLIPSKKAAAGLVVTAPLLALIALAVKLDSKGPVLYRQKRAGRFGDTFKMHKFRTMRIDAEANGPVWAARQMRKKPMPRANEDTGRDTGNPVAQWMTSPIALPSAMPSTPPAEVRNAASIRNCHRISRRRAPSAFRTPISRVRSVTEIIMIAMTPMPPTIKAIEEMTTRARTPAWVSWSKAFMTASPVTRSKSSGWSSFRL